MTQSVAPVKILIKVIDPDLQEEAGAEGQHKVQRAERSLINRQRRPHQQGANGGRQRKWPRHLEPYSPRRPDFASICLCLAHRCSLIVYSSQYSLLLSIMQVQVKRQSPAKKLHEN